MNALFNQIDGQPMRGYYPFVAWRNLRRLGTRVKTTSEFKNAACHLTDRNFIYTASDPELNADGSIDLTMAPCSFAYVEVTPRPCP